MTCPVCGSPLSRGAGRVRGEDGRLGTGEAGEAGSGRRRADDAILTSDELKEDIVRKIQNACMGWATPEQLHDIEAAAIIALHGVGLAQNETATSV